MTREEIENTPKIVDYVLSESLMSESKEKLHKRLDEICNLAIKALEQEPCEDCQYKEWLKGEVEQAQTGDCISRAEVQTEIMMFADNKKIDDDIYIKVSDAVELLRKLHSVIPIEPKTNVLDKIRAEIHKNAEMQSDGEWYLNEKWIMQIIDKYKEG